MNRIVDAAARGDTKAIRKLLSNGTMVDEKDENDNTALMHAAYNGRVEAVRLLVAHGAMVNITDKNNQTALHFAALNGHKEVVKILIEEGADINVKESSYDQTALFLATKNGHEEIVFLLLNAKGIQVEKPGATPLIAAANKGYTRIAKALLGKGADVNAVDAYGKSALMHAANQGQGDMVKLLLENGANVAMQDSRGLDPATLATMGGHDELARLLRNRKDASRARADDANTVYVSRKQEQEKNPSLRTRTHYYKQSPTSCCGNCYRFFIGLNGIDGYCSNPAAPSSPMKVDPDSKCGNWQRRKNW